VKVLLAEDNVINQRVAVGLLSKRGHEVTVATNGRETVEAIGRDAFDVVLMDVQMPEMGGFEATAAIRALEKTTGSHVRIVAMTAHAMKGDRERCLAAGMDDYLAKPIDPGMLYEAVERAGGGSAGEAASRHRGDAVFRLDDVLPRLGNDEELLADVIRLFLEDAPRRLKAIEQAVSERNARQIRAEAHALKGSASNLSARGVVEAALALERIGEQGHVDAADAAWRRVETEMTRLTDALRRFSDQPQM
jgi:CheY-like chemotaxis protein